VKTTIGFGFVVYDKSCNDIKIRHTLCMYNIAADILSCVNTR
jgi:hypothetical protein